MSKIFITIDQRRYDNALQISITDGSTGYRIAGPKYDGNGRQLLKHELTKRDVDEIRNYLDRLTDAA